MIHSIRDAVCLWTCCAGLAVIGLPLAAGEVALPQAAPLTSARLEELVRKELGDVELAPPVTDEIFLRRLTQDLVGRQPTMDELQQFLGDASADKRDQAVDRLLSSPEFGRNWADYWSDVIAFRTPPPELTFLNYDAFKGWLAQKLNDDAPWDATVREILTASGKIKDNPAGTFVGFHQGETTRLAGETARVFLSLQIGCAQCHDHPFDDWKREQFHELAAYYARVSVKLPWNDSGEIEIKDKGKGEYEMPNVADPTKKGEVMTPVFLTGSRSDKGKSDAERRKELAEAIAHRDNPWFARAYVNRVWARLMGRGFYEPVDDFGPAQTARLQETHDILAAAFRDSGFSTKVLFRLIVQTEIYRRGALTQTDDAPVYAGAPTGKLRGDEVFRSLVTAVGLPNVTPEAMKATKDIRFPPPPKSTRDIVAETFGYDPSLRPEDISRTMSQALLLMNNDQIQAQINAQPDSGTVLSRLVATEADDAKAVQQLFVMSFGRQPTEKEQGLALGHVRAATNRGEAYEDLLWSLLNSAEFASRR